MKRTYWESFCAAQFLCWKKNQMYLFDEDVRTSSFFFMGTSNYVKQRSDNDRRNHIFRAVFEVSIFGTGLDFLDGFYRTTALYAIWDYPVYIASIELVMQLGCSDQWKREKRI